MIDPHIADSDKNDELAGDLVTQWNSYGFDSVQTYNYTVLLIFPNKSRSSLNELNIVSSNGSGDCLLWHWRSECELNDKLIKSNKQKDGHQIG